MATRLPAHVTLYFIRHGQTDWNLEGRLQGQTDIPLNATGRAQAARNGQVLNEHLGNDAAQFEFVASPLSRTRQTMEIVREQMGLPALDYTKDEGLIEINFGDWEKKTLAEVGMEDPAGIGARDSNKWGVVPPNGESYEMLYGRIAKWFDRVDENLVIVSHGGVMRVLRLYLEPELDPADVPHLTVPQDKVLVFRNGKVSWI